MPVEDRRALRHGVHQIGTPLDGREAVREDGDLRDRHTVELYGVEHGILPQDKALLGCPRVGVLVVIDLPEHHRDAVFAFADAPPGSFDLVERRPERRGKAHGREEPDIDAPVGPLAEKVAGQPQRAVPGLLPGHGALLQQGQDAVGDDLVWCLDRCERHRKDLHGRRVDVPGRRGAQGSRAAEG
jgi:hypothetical protein